MVTAMVLPAHGPAVRSIETIFEVIETWPEGEPFPVSLKEADRIARYFAEVAYDGSPELALEILERVTAGRFQMLGHQIKVL